MKTDQLVITGRVRVVRPTGFKGFIQSRDHRRLVGETGVLLWAEIGRYGGSKLYSVLFNHEDRKKIDVFLEHELERA